MEAEVTGPLERLLASPPYSLAPDDKDGMLREAVMVELNHHFADNGPYRNFCAANDFDPGRFEGGLADVPLVPVSVFKSLGESLRSVSPEDVRFALQSSATSGIPSTVMVDHVTAKRQALAMARVMTDYLGNRKRPFIVFDVDPGGPSRAAVGARRAALTGYLRFASDAHYVMSVDRSDRLVVDHDVLEAALSTTAGQGAVIFGFTYVLHAAVRDALDQGRLRGAAGATTVLHIGGWKKLESEKVSRADFAATMHLAFGVDAAQVIDVYGFTEQMGLNYPDCPEGWKHTPVFSEVFVRDEITGDLLGADSEGLLAFVTPIPHSYPGNAVLTEDIGLFRDDPCPCGRQGRRFRILGRAQRAEVRGCGDVMAARAIGVRVDEPGTVSHDGPLRVLVGGDVAGASDEERLAEVLRVARSGQEWLLEQPIDALIGLIGSVAAIWREQASELRLPDLTFLATWCDPARLRVQADFALRGSRAHADGFRPVPGQPHKMLRAQPRGLVAHWLAGNVPILGMLTLAHSILTKNANVLKAASAHPEALPRLLAVLGNHAYTTVGGHRLDGADLMSSIAVVHFGHDRRDLATELSAAADARIAWGGADAVQAVMALPRKPTCEDMVFGPKLSFMVIGSDALATERDARRLARRAATDASVFEQTACASPHNVFVERGGKVAPRDFARMLSEEMDKALMRLPKDPASAEWVGDVRRTRAVHQFVGDVWSGGGNDWTVLYSDRESLAAPVYSRTVSVCAVDDVADVVKHASPEIQTVGLALTGERRLSFAEMVTQRGVERCPDIGSMTHFDAPWDGLVPMERMVRWTTLGGP